MTAHVSNEEVQAFIADLIQLTEDENMPLRKLFTRMDRTHDKHITAEEIVKTMQKFGRATVSLAVVRAAIASEDKEHDGRLTFAEFVRIVANRHDGDACAQHDRYAVPEDLGADNAGRDDEGAAAQFSDHLHHAHEHDGQRGPGGRSWVSGAREQVLTSDELRERHAEEIVELLTLAMHRGARSPADLFSAMDTDRSGRVSFSQFRRAVRDAGCHVPKDDALRIFGMYDRDQDGTIAYREFLDLLGVRHGETSARIKAAGGDAAALAPPRRSHLAGSVGDAERAAMAEIMRAINNEHHKLREVFETLDTSGAHTVSWKEFKDGIRSLGAQVSKADVLRLFSRYDRDHHGRIRYSEFVRMVSEGGLGGEIDRDYESHLPKPSRSEALIRERDDKIAREFASTGGSSAAASELLTDFLATSDDNPLSASSNPAHYARQRDMTRLERMHVSAVHKFYTHATQMRDMFLELDTGRSGRVTHAEMSRGLRGLGLKVTEGEVAEIAGPYEDSTGGLDYNGFIAFLAGRAKELADYEPPESIAYHDRAEVDARLRGALAGPDGGARLRALLELNPERLPLSCAELAAVLEAAGIPEISREDAAVLARGHGLLAGRKLDYEAFVDLCGRMAAGL